MAQLTNSKFSAEDFLFCKKSLAKVSRTFALNIKILEGDLFKSVLLCYLLCRIIDTVEDCPDQNAQWKIELLNEFPQYLEAHDDEKLQLWISRALEGKSKPAEGELLEQTACVLRGYWSLPEDLRHHNQRWVTEMSEGMAKYIDKFSDGSDIVLKDRAELEDYCYYVAGTVGLFLTDSFQDYYKFSTETSMELERNAISFGLGLQFTNIAKDVIEDRLRGWTYLPLSYLEKYSLGLDDFMKLSPDHHAQLEKAYLDLLDDALSHLKNALEYTLALPPQNLRPRIFCLWPLWMAVETLIVLKDQHRNLMLGKKVKISRAKVKEIMAKTTMMAPFNELLRRDFESKLELYEALSPIE